MKRKTRKDLPQYPNFSDFLRPYKHEDDLTEMREAFYKSLYQNKVFGLEADIQAWMYETLEDQTRKTLRNTIQTIASDNLRLEYSSTYIWGSWDAYWVAFYLFPHLHIRPMHTDEQMVLLNEWADLCKNSGYVYTYEEVAVVCDRPTAIHLDDNNRLHATEVAALSYADGYAIYADHGVVLSAWIITNPELITPEKINAEQNAEIRRVMMRNYGFDRYFDELGAKMVDSHPDPTIGQLWKWTDRDGLAMACVRVQNGTPEKDGSKKWYCLRVDPRIQDVVSAVKSTYPLCADMTNEEFIQMSECRT